MKNRLNFVFNAHLPFVRHPEYPKFLEEDWLFEAMNESYIPMLRMMYGLREDKVDFHLSFSISPSLVEMLKDKLLQQRFVSYMESSRELGMLEEQRTINDACILKTVRMYNASIAANMEFYEKECSSNILNAFNSLSNSGHLELITTAATHSFLPLFRNHPSAINAQIEIGLINHMKIFDKCSNGFWLPDCGYYPGLSKYLRKHSIKWTVLAPQAFALSNDKPLNGSYSPVMTEDGLCCFASDYSLVSEIMSSEGYPSNPVYREFYRDIGYDLPLDYIKPYIHEPEIRVFTGFKYWAITGNTAEKIPYDVSKATAKACEHADDFIAAIRKKSDDICSYLKTDPIFTLSFDAELFGHRWFEGIVWLENFIRKAAGQKDFEFVTPSMILQKKPKLQILEPAYSSSSPGGYSQELVDNTSNAWLLRYIYKSIERMTELADRFPLQKSLKQRFLNQAARETLLLMSSDWPTIIHNNTSSEYARKRIICHIQSLNLVYEDMCKNAVNTEWLVKAEKRDNIFADLDYNIFNSKHIDEPSLLFTTKF